MITRVRGDAVSNGVAAIAFQNQHRNPMHTSPNAPAADAGKQANDPSSTVTDHEPSALKVTKASIDAFAFVALDASHPRLPTLAEARTYWVLSRS